MLSICDRDDVVNLSVQNSCSGEDSRHQSLSVSDHLVKTAFGFEVGSVISAGYGGRSRRWDVTLYHGSQPCYLSLSTDEVVRLLRGLDIAEADVQRAIVIRPRRHTRKDG
jgi:hypothetical protein